MTRGDGIWAHPWDLSARRVEAVAASVTWYHLGLAPLRWTAALRWA